MHYFSYLLPAMLKRARCLSILAIAFAAFLSGFPSAKCAAADKKLRRTEDGALIVEFWHAMAGRHQKILLEIVGNFNKSNKEIRILPIYQGSYDSLSQKLVASCISGSNPAMSQMYESWTTRFMSRKLIAPVEDLAAGDAPAERTDLQDIIGAFREDNTWTVDGKPKLMTLPFNKSIYILYMNEDRMREAGWDHPPRDWKEWRELAGKMTKRNPDGSIAMFGFATRPLLESFTTNLFLAGPRYLDDKERLDFADPEGLKALKFLVDMTMGDQRVGYVESDYLNAAFGSGKIGMYVGSTASFPYNDSAVAGRFTWRAYPLPVPEGGPGRVLCQGTNVGIFANHPPEVQRAAWAFLKFMTNTENTTRWAIETGYLPIRYSSLESERMKAYMADNVNYKNAVSQIDRGFFEPKAIYWESCRLALTREIDAALNGRKTPEKALADALEKCKYIQDTE